MLCSGRLKAKMMMIKLISAKYSELKKNNISVRDILWHNNTLPTWTSYIYDNMIITDKISSLTWNKNI